MYGYVIENSTLQVNSKSGHQIPIEKHGLFNKNMTDGIAPAGVRDLGYVEGWSDGLFRRIRKG